MGESGFNILVIHADEAYRKILLRQIEFSRILLDRDDWQITICNSLKEAIIQDTQFHLAFVDCELFLEEYQIMDDVPLQQRMLNAVLIFRRDNSASINKMMALMRYNSACTIIGYLIMGNYPFALSQFLTTDFIKRTLKQPI